MLMPLSRLTMTSAPMMEPVALPVPPLRLVPPIYTGGDGIQLEHLTCPAPSPR